MGLYGNLAKKRQINPSNLKVPDDNLHALLVREPILTKHVVQVPQYTCNYYSTIVPYYHIRAKERAKYNTLLHCRTGQKYGLKRSDKMAAQNERRNGGIINPLIDGLTYNTSGHFAHCSYFSSPLRASEKYYATRKLSARIIC